MSTAALVVKVKARIGDDRLKQLTNYDPTATAIEEDVLSAACDDAIGDFERVSGATHDTEYRFHTATLVLGVIMHLENYKSRDSSLMSTTTRSFFSACENIRRKAYSVATSNSNLTRSTQRAGTLPDMDRSRNVFKCRPQGVNSSNSDTWEN